MRIFYSTFAGLMLGVSLFFLFGFSVSPVISLESQPKLNFNEHFIKQSSTAEIDLSDADTVLEYILKGMDGEIMVYPSEGYYHFNFYSNGDLIRGNLRFDKLLRDDGKVSFAYYRALRNTRSENHIFHHILDNEKEGFSLIRTGNFSYKLKFREQVAKVRIYDAITELASPPNLYKNEQFVGPSFDESGIRFDLIFDLDSREFLYLLNTDFGFPEGYETIEGLGENILIGARTGFAFYRDKTRDRYILIGVYAENIRNNSYFDGPFDQLPDSFVDGKTLQQLIEDHAPDVKGLVGPYGHYLHDKDIRFAISPYMAYENASELVAYNSCKLFAQESSRMNFCLSQSPE